MIAHAIEKYNPDEATPLRSQATPLASDPSSQLNILLHHRHPFRMDSTQVSAQSGSEW